MIAMSAAIIDYPEKPREITGLPEHDISIYRYPNGNFMCWNQGLVAPLSCSIGQMKANPSCASRMRFMK
jgi:hypothetical protein